MSKTTKAKSKAAPAAQSREEVDYLIGFIGNASRKLTRLEADLGDEVAAAKERAESLALPLKAEILDAQARVQGWCEANRAEITSNGRTKTAGFTSGEVKWRLRPMSVKVRSVDAVIALLKDRFQGRFLRTKVEVDKEALLADVETARTIPGVMVGSEGEDFVIEPFEAELTAVA
ncbi:MAG: gam [Caulobacter sp.]|nr:gam [Caulobacter sp.]